MMRRLPHRRHSTARDERGAVMVLVAVTLPVIFLFVAFGVEVGHWYDYSRNLQNRADAAALAAGDAFGATCFGSNVTSAQTDVIGQTAQQYAGPPVRTQQALDGPENLPYPYSTFAQYQNQPNLTRGTPPNYHVLLNSTAYWNNGGTNWSMESADQTKVTRRRRAASPSAARPTRTTRPVRWWTSASHSRTSASSSRYSGSHPRSAPMRGSAFRASVRRTTSFRSPSATPRERCVAANFFNSSAQIASVPLKKKGVDPNTGDVQWDNSAAPVAVSFPSG